MVYYAESAIVDHQFTIKLFLGAMNTESFLHHSNYCNTFLLVKTVTYLLLISFFLCSIY